MNSFYNTSRETQARAEGDALAKTLTEQGGTCRVGNKDGFVDILLRDGRCFKQAGVHGSGGIISPRYGAHRVRKELGLRGHLIVYLVSGWWGDHKLRIEAEDIISIELSEALS